MAFVALKEITVIVNIDVKNTFQTDQKFEVCENRGKFTVSTQYWT